jgi:hypothetical protein
MKAHRSTTESPKRRSMQPIDTLITRDGRDESLEFIRAGVPIVARHFGISLNGEFRQATKAQIDRMIERPQMSNPDRFFQLIQDNLYPPDTAFDALLPDHFDWSQFDTAVLERYQQTDETLIAEARARLGMVEAPMTEALAKKAHVSIKVNHGYWEQMMSVVLREHDLPLHREFGELAEQRFKTSGFASLLTTAFRRHLLAHGQAGDETATLDRPDCSFGLSLNAGDYASNRDLRTPMLAVARGALIGLMSHFDVSLPARRFVVSDGGAAKQLVYAQQFEPFLKEVGATSDLVMLVVPTLLRSIRIPGWQGPTQTVVIPQQKVHELWPVVLPYLAGALTAAAARHRRITVLTQAAVMTAPVGFLFDHMNRESGLDVRYFDLGQVLNVLADPDNVPAQRMAAGFMRRNEAQELARKLSGG